MATLTRIAGPLDADRFMAALAALVAEADVLRAVVDQAGGDPFQVVGAQAGGVQMLDVSADADPFASAMRWAGEDCRKTFDLASETWRGALLRLGAEDWAWYFVQHHVFGDAASFAILFRRLADLYAGPGGDPLPPIADLAQHTPPEGDPFAEAARLVPAPLYGRTPAAETTRSHRVTVELGEDRTRRLGGLLTHPAYRALTPQMSHHLVFATAFAAYLSRATGEDALCIGMPVHNRATSAARTRPGLMIEVFPMRVEVDPGKPVQTLADAVRSGTSDVLRKAAPGMGRLSHQRAFNAIFNHVTAQYGTFDGRPVDVTWLHPGHADPHHHLRLQVEAFGQTGLRLHFDMNEAVFDARQRDEAVAHFLTVLDAVLEDDAKALAALPMLSPQELQRQTVALTGPAGPASQETLVSRFDACAAAHPDAVALRQGPGTVTYAELAARVADLAGVLAARGAGPETRVALCLGRGVAAVVGMLAVMKTGAAVVPVDPCVPPARLGFLLSDMEPVAILAAEPLPVDGVEPLLLDTDGKTHGQPSAAPRGPERANPAYVLYTSGSTGQPKGVVVSHASAMHYIGWAAETYTKGQRLAFPLFTPLTFDLTLTSIFVPLITGGEIVIHPETDGRIDTGILDVIAEDAVDIVKLTPSHLRMIEEQDLSASRIRQMIVGGEDFPTDLARRIHEASQGRIALHNEYGPTEATVGCIVHTFDPSRDLGASVPIGTPIPNMHARLVTAGGQPVPEGVPGELWLGGAGLAEGYLNRPDLTAERFVPSGEERLYRTGDLARLEADGTLHYLGRADQQVKLNGIRIEPGEVEAALSAHPAVEACVVTVPESDVRRDEPDRFCLTCGLPSTYPDVEIGDDGICALCRDFESYRAAAESYFSDLDELRAIMARRHDPDAPYDCMALLSGGKDSTYMVARLVDLGFRVLAFTLDNGFISEQAKANIARVVRALGIDHVYGRTPAMNEIFADSLRRNSNVCHGCFKTIYTLSMQEARARRIPYIVTGLSRGQFFETRLTPDLFREGTPERGEIDAMVLRARKAYHRVDDAVSRLLDVAELQDDAMFEEVELIDFYRYCDVPVDALYAYLDARLPWVRPSDTGRSTNCLINDVGIWVHKRERGYHNYALPYSWDVRMGHKTREAALEELDDEIDETYVRSVLDTIAYRPEGARGRQSLTAYVVTRRAISDEELSDTAARHLPEHMRPARYIRLDALPLSANGKIDRKALQSLTGGAARPRAEYVAPEDGPERVLAGIWQEVLKVPRIGTRDNFYDLGGDSITAIQIVARATEQGLGLRPGQLFDAPTVGELARAVTPVAPAARPEAPRRDVSDGDKAKLARLLAGLDGGGA